MIEAVRSDQEQVEAALLLYNSTTDKSNFGLVVNAIQFQSSRQKVMDKIHTMPLPSPQPQSQPGFAGPYGGGGAPQPGFGGP